MRWRRLLGDWKPMLWPNLYLNQPACDSCHGPNRWSPEYRTRSTDSGVAGVRRTKYRVFGSIEVSELANGRIFSCADDPGNLGSIEYFSTPRDLIRWSCLEMITDRYKKCRRLAYGRQLVFITYQRLWPPYFPVESSETFQSPRFTESRHCFLLGEP